MRAVSGPVDPETPSRGWLRALVVEDEPPSRARLVEALHATPEVAHISEAADADAARAALGRSRFDVLFLDIQLPGDTGLVLASELGGPGRPHVVFVTAHPQHALAAFGVDALGYLLKPWSREHLARVVARVAALAPWRQPQRLVLRRGAHASVVDPSEVLAIAAARNYVRVRTRTGELLAREPFAALLRRLPVGVFVRVHRSLALRRDAITGLEPGPDGALRVILADGARHVVGRGWSSEVRRALGEW